MATVALTVKSSTAARMAPHTVHFNCVQSSTGFDGVGQPQWRRAKIVWTIGETGVQTTTDPRPDKGGSIDLGTDQRGFNGAYRFNSAGTYSIAVQVTDEFGTIYTDSTNVTVVADSRTVIYCDPSATGANNGITEADAYTDLAAAVATVSGPTRLKLKRGQVFNLTAATSDISSNVLVEDYGTGALPVVRWNTTDAGVRMFGFTGENCALTNIEAQTRLRVALHPSQSYTLSSNVVTVTTADHGLSVGDSVIINSSPFGNGLTKTVATVPTSSTFTFAHTAADQSGVLVWRWSNNVEAFTGGVNATYLNVVTDGVSRTGEGFERVWNFSMNGLYALNCTTGYVYAYHAWLDNCNDVVFHGWDATGTTNEHIMRLAQNRNDRVNISFCRLDHDNNQGGKVTVRINWCVFFYSHWCFHEDGNINIGFDNENAENVVFEGNNLQPSETTSNTGQIIFHCGGSKIMLRNNVFDINSATQRFLFTRIGESPTTIIDTVDIYNNSFINRSSITQQACSFLGLTLFPFEVDNVEFKNNLFVGQIANYNVTKTALQFDGQYTWASANNVLPAYGANDVGLDYLGAGNVDITAWNALPEVTNDVLEEVPESAVVSPDYRPDPGTYTEATTNAVVLAGVHDDYHGEPRPSSGSWYAGAVAAVGSVTIPRPKGLDIKIERKYHKRLRR